jgi:hypothetical protein
MVVIVLIHLFVQLTVVSYFLYLSSGACKTHQIEYRDLHHTLVEVCSSVLDHLHGNHLLRLQVLALYDLPKGTLAEHIQDQIPVLVPRLLGAENVIDIEDIIAVLIVVSVILDSARIAGRLVIELGIAQLVRSRQVSRQGLKRLFVMSLAKPIVNSILLHLH